MRIHIVMAVCLTFAMSSPIFAGYEQDEKNKKEGRLLRVYDEYNKKNEINQNVQRLLQKRKQRSRSLISYPKPHIEIKIEDQIIALYKCTDKKIGVSLLCNEEWRLHEGKESILLVMYRNPAVTLTVTRISKELKFLTQLDKDSLKSLGNYKDGFRSDYDTIAGEKAIKVNGFSEEYPNIRLQDYYVLHNGQLYGFLFSVNPKQEWDSYKFLIKKMSESFEFTDKNTIIKKVEK